MIALAFALIGLLAPPLLSANEQKEQPKAARVAVAKYVTPTGLLFRREALGKPWQVVKEGEALYSGDLFLGLPTAAVESNNGAVRLTFISDPSGHSPFPIVETAIVLHENKEVDLDFFLERGRVDCLNLKKEKARIHGRIRKEAPGGLVTADPGAQVVLEVFGRWPAGVPFKKDADPDHAPMLNVIFLVLKGEIELKLDNRVVAMKAPPGPAVIIWDSITGGDPTPQKLEKLPDWAAGVGKDIDKKKALIAEFQKMIVTKSIDEALDTFAKSDDPDKRRAAVNAMGALDDLKRLADVLTNAKHADTWDFGVRALRHWIGRGPGQDKLLYDSLIKEGKFKEREAETVMQLLHSFSDDQLTKPELYEVLIDYLDHERLAIRGLAHWHLYRLVADGRKIGYDPTAAKEARTKAIEQWRKLIPPGKLPPPPKIEEK